MISSDSYWTKMCTYTTVKKAQIIDPKIALSHKAVMIGITAWILTGVFRDFNYVKTETPGMSVNPYIDQAGFYDQQTKLQAAPPWYCNNPKTDYNYSATWRYENNDCVFGLTLADVMTKTESAVFITTYFQDTPSDATSAAAAGLTAKNYFVPGVDKMMLWFDHSVITSWGTKVTNPSFDVTSFGSDAVLKSYTRGQEVGIKLEDLLAMTGANLDAENVASFGAPLYRITGLHVQMSVQYRNTHAGEAFDPDDVRGRGTVRYSPGVWASLGPKIVYKKGSDGELHKFQRYHYVLRVSLEQGGEVHEPRIAVIPKPPQDDASCRGSDHLTRARRAGTEGHDAAEHSVCSNNLGDPVLAQAVLQNHDRTVRRPPSAACTRVGGRGATR